jgi:hypothetical protein
MNVKNVPVRKASDSVLRTIESAQFDGWLPHDGSKGMLSCDALAPLATHH